MATIKPFYVPMPFTPKAGDLALGLHSKGGSARFRGRACAWFSGSVRMSAIADKPATTSEAAQSS
jgi:hypothetical protein